MSKAGIEAFERRREELAEASKDGTIVEETTTLFYARFSTRTVSIVKPHGKPHCKLRITKPGIDASQDTIVEARIRTLGDLRKLERLVMAAKIALGSGDYGQTGGEEFSTVALEDEDEPPIEFGPHKNDVREMDEDEPPIELGPPEIGPLDPSDKRLE